MSVLIASIIRTIVPALVGSVTGWLVQLGLEVDPEFRGALSTVLSVAFTGLYYIIVRVIEQKVPALGVLLGYAKSPDAYSKGEVVKDPVAAPTVVASELAVDKTVDGR